MPEPSAPAPVLPVIGPGSCVCLLQWPRPGGGPGAPLHTTVDNTWSGSPDLSAGQIKARVEELKQLLASKGTKNRTFRSLHRIPIAAKVTVTPVYLMPTLGAAAT